MASRGVAIREAGKVRRPPGESSSHARTGWPFCAQIPLVNCVNVKTSEEGTGLSKDEQNLARMVALASGFGLGALLALSEALRLQDDGATLQFSVRSAVAFAVGFVAAYGYLNQILRSPERTSKFFFRIGLGVLFTLVGIAFGYPLRLFAIRTLMGKLVGALAALGVIAVGFTLVRCFVHSAEVEEAEQEAKERGSNTASPP